MKWNDEVDMIVSHMDKVTSWLESTIRNAFYFYLELVHKVVIV